MNRDGRVLFCVSASKGWYQKIIRKLTKSKVNHSFLLFHCALIGGWWAIEIDEKGVRILPYEKVIKDKSFIWAYEYNNNIGMTLKTIKNSVGNRYDYLGILGFLWHLVAFRWFNKRTGKNLLHGKSAMFCSEFVTTFMQSCGIGNLKRLDPALTAPGDLLEFMEHRAHGFEKVSLPSPRC